MRILKNERRLPGNLGRLVKSAAVCGIALVLGLACLYGFLNGPTDRSAADPSFRTNRGEIQIFREGTWEPFEIKGVNVGTGYPGVFPNEFGIDEDTYYRWFEQIGAMNANTIRVYKLQSPAFYGAFSRYNETHGQKLYLVQGVDFSESIMYSEHNLLEEKYKKKIFAETYDVVDVLHGRKTKLDRKTGSLYWYEEDVSRYVLGYVLGIEWDEYFVTYLCRLNEGIGGYRGEYLYSREDANAFEIFLTEWGDRILAYEQREYHTQKLISFCNWAETDPLVNILRLNEVEGDGQEKRIEAFVDVEKIRLTEKVSSGLFASYNVYPYYPYFLQAGEYAEYMDETGNRNPYRKYLLELVAHHGYPVVISEFGVPASRKKAYEDSWRNLSHGGLNEKQQGEAILTLYEDIRKAGCAGAVVFSWQDEWYKRTWNEKAISDPDRRAYWCNAQSAEQFYGLLAFEPGDAGANNYPDGDLSEWSAKDLVMDSGTTRLSMKSDEKYVYFLVEGLDSRAGHDAVRIALDITPKSGAAEQDRTRFGRPVDFIIRIDPEGESALWIQDYSDLLLYSLYENNSRTDYETMYKLAKKYGLSTGERPDGSEFGIVCRATGSVYGYFMHRQGIEEVGRLTRGNANPDSAVYDSNADYCISGDAVEIRIPWQLLNFYDPSVCEIVDDYHENRFRIRGLKIKAIYGAAYYDDDPEAADFGRYSLKGWERPRWHERLKASYDMLQKAFAG